MNRLISSLDFCGISKGLDYLQRTFLIFLFSKEVASLLRTSFPCWSQLHTSLAFAKEAQSTKKVNESSKVTQEQVDKSGSKRWWSCVESDDNYFVWAFQLCGHNCVFLPGGQVLSNEVMKSLKENGQFQPWSQKCFSSFYLFFFFKWNVKSARHRANLVLTFPWKRYWKLCLLLGRWIHLSSIYLST